MMMRSLLCVPLVACVALAAAQSEENQNRKMAESFFAQLDASINKNKPTVFFSMLAPGYYNVDTDGHKMTYSQFKAGVMQMWSNAKDVTSTTTIKNVQLMNDEEVVWTQQVMTWKMRKGNGWVTMKETTRWAENLKMVDGKWKLASSQQLMTNEPWTFKTN